MSIKPINKNKVSVGRKEKDKSEFLLHVDLATLQINQWKNIWIGMKELNQKY